MTSLNNSNDDTTQITKLQKNPKTQIVTKLKNSNCDKTQIVTKLKLWQNSKCKRRKRKRKNKLQQNATFFRQQGPMIQFQNFGFSMYLCRHNHLKYQLTFITVNTCKNFKDLRGKAWVREDKILKSSLKT